MSRIFVIGLGPGKPSQRTPEAQEALAQATDVIGYGPYVDRVDLPAHITRHPSDNRVELDRAHHALELAEQGRCVAIVSGGDAACLAWQVPYLKPSITNRIDGMA